jgi:hypothetical protein
MYCEQTGLSEKLSRVSNSERDLDDWLAQLPANIRPSPCRTRESGLALGTQHWAKLQTLVLEMSKCRSVFLGLAN